MDNMFDDDSLCEEAARWEARRLAGIHAHMERAKAAVRVSRK